MVDRHHLLRLGPKMDPLTPVRIDLHVQHCCGCMVFLQHHGTPCGAFTTDMPSNALETCMVLEHF